MKYDKVPSGLFFAVFILGSIFWAGDLQKSDIQESPVLGPSNATSLASTGKVAEEKRLEIKNESIAIQEQVIIQLKSDLSSYRECLIDDQCRADQEPDPRSRQMTVARELAYKVDQRYIFIANKKMQSPKIAELAREILMEKEGYIKESALKLLLTQDAAAENIEAVSEGVLDFHDSNLLDLAIQELSRHLGGDGADRVHEKVRAALFSGSLLVRQGLSEKIQPFINEGSFDFYERAAQDPMLDTKVKSNLQSSLAEWRLQKAGG
ncbi:MAG: hypothetical protein RJB66_1090 [Pseudomonadota bacterium]|jgi:hypothetical protein